jgi:DNA modification methylase
MDSVRIEAGDCVAVMARLKAEGVWVDAVVTDPPYHLTSIVKRFGAENAAPVKVPANGTGAYARTSKGFMGKVWDGGDVAFRVETWRAVFDVMKPGAHLVAFGGTRTYHRMACAIEDAGFEIRDSILELVAGDAAVRAFLDTLSAEQAAAFLRCVEDSQFGGLLEWVYGSGFPKSHDVSKGIDRARDDYEDICRVALWLRPHIERVGFAIVTKHFGFKDETMARARWTTRSQPQVPTWDQWLALKGLLKFGDEMDAEVWRLNGRKGTPGEAWAEREFYDEPTGGLHGGTGNTVGAFAKGRQAKPGGVTDAAKQWAGWGTALKPAWEPIVLARKPLDGTVAETVLKHGTGALNIDGCRVGDEEISQHGRTKDDFGFTTAEAAGRAWTGRWPANVVHDGSPEVLAGFPYSESAPTRSVWKASATNTIGLGINNGPRPGSEFSDSGSAARFFYCAKADEGDRLGSKHPTVKPVDLMAWLVRLVTPKSVLSCPACDNLSHGKSTKNTDTNPPVRGMSETVQTAGQRAHWQVLQPSVRGPSQEAPADSVRMVRDDVPAEEGRREEVLHSDMRREMEREEPTLGQGLRDHEARVQAAEDAGTPASQARLHLRASLGDGTEDRSDANAERGCASRKWGEVGQPSREPGVDDEDSARRAEASEAGPSDVPALSRARSSKPHCSRCGTELVSRPGLVLDPFAGTGTTGMACLREGMRALLIEREAEYLADIRRRLDHVSGADTPLFGGGA